MLAIWGSQQEMVVPNITFMTEEEQSDDPQAIRRWIDDVRSLPPLSMTPEEESDMLAWGRKVKEFNLEAVRKQMEEGLTRQSRKLEIRNSKSETNSKSEIRNIRVIDLFSFSNFEFVSSFGFRVSNFSPHLA